MPSAFAGNKSGIEQLEIQASVLLGDQQSGKAHLDKAGPDRLVAIGTCIKTSQNLRAVSAGKIIAHSFSKFEAVRFNQEFHEIYP